MAEFQTDIHSTLADLWLALDAAATGQLESTEALYKKFCTAAWEQLPTGNAKGSALATASCIPLWEMLNCVSSTYSHLDVTSKARVVLMLTAMYPKSKDRRALYQQLSRFTGGVNTSVPLSTETPALTEATQLFFRDNRVPQILEAVNLQGVDPENPARNLKKVSTSTKVLLEKILPSSIITFDTTSSEFTVRCGSQGPFSLNGFLLVVWKCLVYSELMNTPERRQLSQYLTTSAWASKEVERAGEKIEYAAFFKPLVSICAVCLSQNPRTPATAIDNVPMFDPRLVPLLLAPESCLSPPVVDQLAVGANARATDTKLSLSSVDNAKKLHDETVQKLKSDIPGEVDFMGSSSTCRDCDSVTILCRDMMFSNLSGVRSPGDSKTSLLHAALFSRKRARDDSSSGEGPSFVPVASSISDMLSDGKAESLTTLERLAMSWRV